MLTQCSPNAHPMLTRNRAFIHSERGDYGVITVLLRCDKREIALTSRQDNYQIISQERLIIMHYNIYKNRAKLSLSHFC